MKFIGADDLGDAVEDDPVVQVRGGQGRAKEEVINARIWRGLRELHIMRSIRIRGKDWDIFRLVNYLGSRQNSFSYEKVKRSEVDAFQRVAINEVSVRVFDIPSYSLNS